MEAVNFFTLNRIFYPEASTLNIFPEESSITSCRGLSRFTVRPQSFKCTAEYLQYICRGGKVPLHRGYILYSNISLLLVIF